MPVIFEPIPTTWEDAVFRICSNLNEEEKENLKEHGYAVFHHGLGTAIRNNWGLWNEDSDLHKSFKEGLGLFHADDMSGIILRAAEATARGEPNNPKGWAEEYKNYWKEQDK